MSLALPEFSIQRAGNLSASRIKDTKCEITDGFCMTLFYPFHYVLSQGHASCDYHIFCLESGLYFYISDLMRNFQITRIIFRIFEQY